MSKKCLKMSKTEKLILLLFRECIGDNGFAFIFYQRDEIKVFQFYRGRLLKTWVCDGTDKPINKQLTTAIKEIRSIKRGEK